MGTKYPWKKYNEIIKDSFKILLDRKQGKIKSLKTKWHGFNKIGINGIEWHSLIIISSRPGVNSNSYLKLFKYKQALPL